MLLKNYNIIATQKNIFNLKIFLPFQNIEFHPYLEEIKKCSDNNLICDKYQNYNSSFGIVNIHWPEAVFNWLEPTERELSNFEKALKLWKNNSVIVYTKHDLVRTKGNTPNFSKLFRIVEENTDVFVHLGEYSKKLYVEKYPNAKHEIIFHPLLSNNFQLSNKNEARETLGIDNEALVIIAPGNIRNFRERKLILKSFTGIKAKNKVLISTNMRNELRYDFPGRIRLKKYFDVQRYVINRFKVKHLPPQYFFTYNPLSTEALSLRMSAADIVIVPRVDILNSGIVFLGLTFRKLIVGPAIGNIEEQLKELNFPIFNPNSITSVTEALERGIKLHLSGEYIGKSIEKYLPINVAKEYDTLFLKYSKQ